MIYQIPRIIALIFLTTLTSCVPTLVGGGDGYTIAYVAGEMQAQEDVGIDDAWIASRRVLENLELQIATNEKDALSAKLVAYGAEDKKISIHLERIEDMRTMFRIRVGLWGDKDFSIMILEKIEAELGLNTRINAPRARLP